MSRVNFICPNCGNDKTYVKDSRFRKNINTIYRRRCCLKCLESFTTYEVLPDKLKVIITEPHHICKPKEERNPVIKKHIYYDYENMKPDIKPTVKEQVHQTHNPSKRELRMQELRHGG